MSTGRAGTYRCSMLQSAESVNWVDPVLQLSSAGLALPAAVVALQGSAMAANTQTAYRSDWGSFARWCRLYSHQAIPADPATVCTYLAELAERIRADGSPAVAPSTIGRRLAAITKMQRAGRAHLTDPPPRRHDHHGRDPPPAPPPDPADGPAPAGRPARRAGTDRADGVPGRGDRPPRRRPAHHGVHRCVPRGPNCPSSSSPTVTRHPQDVSAPSDCGTARPTRKAAAAIRALPYGRHPQTCPPCAWTRWLAVLSAYTEDGRVGILRELRRVKDVGTHVCPERGASATDAAPPTRPRSARVHKTGLPGSGPVTRTCDQPGREETGRRRRPGPDRLRWPLAAGRVRHSGSPGRSRRRARSCAQTGHRSPSHGGGLPPGERTRWSGTRSLASTCEVRPVGVHDKSAPSSRLR